ncbi:hypothetical protein JN531_000025 [Flagellatimonas centrodinii]|uniref:carboxylate--amine ligase n=1 Tax=Flagellatimonas centrodinii TaxID=2806210 RepID=UPI001FEE476B|nr:hypothetical protein [Flagellatimonas centrodinii]ULQ46697.1 hypothetical protein JN531_000025 [Flagellatimonas centrodinii]
MLGSSPTALYAAREASKVAGRVAIADFERGCAFRSSCVQQSRVVTTAGDVSTWLAKFGGAGGSRPLLLPTSDVFIEFVMANAERLSHSFEVLGGYRGVAADLLDKERFHALCHQHGFLTPGVWQAVGTERLLALADEVPFPCILKPKLIHKAKAFLSGKKVLLCRSREEFVSQVHRIPDDSGGWLVQEVIPGPESEITLFGGYIGRDGIARQVFTGRKLRQYPSGFGSASMVTSEPCDETRTLTLGFLQRIGFQGVCGAEFKRDPRDGRLKIIEINPRPTLWFQIAHDAGLRIVEAAWRDMSGKPPLPEGDQRTDVCWRYLLKDIASARFYRRSGKDFVFPPPDVSTARAMTATSWPVFSPGDMLPAVAEPFGFLRKAWMRRK